MATFMTAVMTDAGEAPPVDVVIFRNTVAIDVNPTQVAEQLAQTFLYRGTAPVTLRGSNGQFFDGAFFTKSPGTATAPVSVTIVRDPVNPKMWLRVNG
jgi:hypothetical protein